jgi:hypothetical protein
MRIAILALVVLAASVVVLIFANTLNSWVLGGLIGGLAALLISIPISLLIFTTLARRHDESILAQMAEQEDAANYALDGEEYAEVYDAEAYILSEEDEVYYQDEADYQDYYQRYDNPRVNRVPEMRRLPAPGQSYRRQTHELARYDLEEPDRTVRPTAQSPRFSQSRQNNTRTGHQRQPRAPQTTRSLRSMQHAAALRSAMREAEQEQIDNYGISTASRRHTTPRRLPSQELRLHRTERDQVSGTTGTTGTRRSIPQNNLDGSLRQPGRTGDLQFDQPRGQNPETGPMRVNPDTGKIMHDAHLGDEYPTSENWSGSFNNPMVRRAPYLYEDDPLREHFAQQVEKPITRRSSRYLEP